MNILFFNPPFIDNYSRTVRRSAVTQGETIYYPIWLAYAAAYAESKGFSVKLLDAPLDGYHLQGLHRREDLFDSVKEFKPELIVIETSAYSLYNDIEVVETAKICFPQSFVVFVGIHVSALPEETLKLSEAIDAIIVGEYDSSVCQLALSLSQDKKLETVNGLVFRFNEEIIKNERSGYIENLDEIPFVSKIYKSNLNYNNYFSSISKYPMLMLVTSRGCPYNCIYCAYPQLYHGHKYRTRTAMNVIREINYIIANFPEVKGIGFEDDCFTIDNSRVKEICELLLENKINISWYCKSRADIDIDLLRLMKKAGCETISVGFESGSQKVLNNIKKDINLCQYEKFIKNAKEAHIKIEACFMVGNPGDDAQSIQNTYSIAKTLNSDIIKVYPLYLYVGTEAYAWAKRNNLICNDKLSEALFEDNICNSILFDEHISAKDLVSLKSRFENQYYFRLSYLREKLITWFRNTQQREEDLLAIHRYFFKIIKKHLHKTL